MHPLNSLPHALAPVATPTSPARPTGGWWSRAFGPSAAGVNADLAAGSGGPGTREIALIFGAWTFVALLTAANGLMEPRGRGLQPLLPAAPVALAFIQCYLWAIVTPLVFWLCSRYPIERDNWIARALLYLVVAIVVSNIVSAAIDFMRFEVLYAPRSPPRGPPRGGRPQFEPNALDGIVRLWWLDDLIVFAAILAAGFARDFYLRYRQRREEARLLQTQAAKLQAQLVEARLSALRSQLNPHFLFNTLNAISALVERDPRGVRRMIARLSELLRYSLDEGNESEVPLSRELAFLDRYLEIMQIRFQGRLEISNETDADTQDALVPHLVLQTLVENALKYGVNQQDGTGRIEVTATRAGDRLALRVRDHGPGLPIEPTTPNPSDDSGVGLRNSRARLEQLYGDAGTLELRPAPDGGVIAEVLLPFHTMTDLRTTGEMLRP